MTKGVELATLLLRVYQVSGIGDVIAQGVSDQVSGIGVNAQGVSDQAT